MFRTRPQTACLLFLAFASCSHGPETYPIPAQFVMPSGPEPPAALPDPKRLIIAMADADWSAHVIDGVVNTRDGETFRWFHPTAKFRLTPDDSPHLSFWMRLIVLDEPIRKTGAVTIAISIDGRDFAHTRITRGGDQDFQRPVPSGWLSSGKPVTVSLDFQPPILDARGDQLGVLLHSIGFKP